MKKLFAVLLAAVIAFTGAAHAFALIQFPVTLEGEISGDPVVFVPGYGAAWLLYDDGSAEGVAAWNGVTADELLPNLLHRIADLALGAAAMPFDRADRIGRILAEELMHTWPLLGCAPDGSSTYPLQPYLFDAAETNDAALHAAGNDYAVHEKEIAATLAQFVGEENLFNLNADFRMGAEYCAAQLDRYIQSVKAYTGKEQVNIFGLSHGGQVAATYLALYGEKGDVHNAVLSSPAIGGAALAADLLSGDAHLDETTLVKMIEVGTFTEEAYEWLVKAVNLGFIDRIINAMVPYLRDTMGHWGSIWDFVPAADYEALKAQYLSDPACAPLAAQSDRFHYEILPTVGEKFRALNENGTHISIITGCGDPAVSGMQINSDAIIPVQSATGATCAPFGERFPDGYRQIDACGGNYKVSPDMTIDASTCYLPDQTWFAHGNFHAWTYWTPATRALALELLLTRKIQSVYDDPRYPQFLTSDHISYHVDFEFGGGVPGYPAADCSSVTVRNTCDEGTVRLTGLYCKEAPLAFRLGTGITLRPGESVTVPFTGALPKSGPACLHLTACYTVSNITPFNYRTKGFTVRGTDTLPAADGTVRVNAGPFPDSVDAFLQRLGLRDYFALPAMRLISALRAVRNAVA